MAADVLILGGYGTTGKVVAELVLAHSDATVVVAGRNLQRAERAAATLNARFPGRAAARFADAADPASLTAAFAGVGIVAVAASVMKSAGVVAEAALQANADYFDLLLSAPAKHAVLERFRARIEQQQRCYITDGGIHPGLSAAMIRALAPAFGRLERADVAGLLKLDWSAYDFGLDTIYEFVEELAAFRPEALRDGAWVRLPWKAAMKRFDFGPPYGAERCTVMGLEELRLLPREIASLRDCGFYVSGFNPLADNVLVPLGLVVMKLAPRAMGRPYARLFAVALRRFARPPFGVVWQLEAEGVAAGETAGGEATRSRVSSGTRLHAGLRLRHEDGYWLTAATAAACLLQYLDGSLRTPGLHLQALAVAPGRLLRDLQRMGVVIDSRGVDLGALLRAAE